MIFRKVMRKLISSFSKQNHDASIENSSDLPFDQIAAPSTNVPASLDRWELGEESLKSHQSTTTSQDIEIVEGERASSSKVRVLPDPIPKVITPIIIKGNNPTEDKNSGSKISQVRILNSSELRVIDEKAI